METKIIPIVAEGTVCQCFGCREPCALNPKSAESMSRCAFHLRRQREAQRRHRQRQQELIERAKRAEQRTPPDLQRRYDQLLEDYRLLQGFSQRLQQSISSHGGSSSNSSVS